MMHKIFFLFLIFCLLQARGFSQSSSLASARATIVEPVTMTRAVETTYGAVAVIVAGTVEVIPVKIPAGTASITLPTGESGTFTAATFALEGNSAFAYTIAIPKAPLEINRSSGTMVVNSFVSDPILGTNSGLASGVYVSVTPLNLTVNYN